MISFDQRKNLLIWSLAFLGLSLIYFISQNMIVELFGKVSWTGVTNGTLVNIITAIANGASITNAVLLFASFIAGPLAAALTAIGRGLIIQLIKRWGVKKLASW